MANMSVSKTEEEGSKPSTPANECGYVRPGEYWCHCGDVEKCRKR